MKRKKRINPDYPCVTLCSNRNNSSTLITIIIIIVIIISLSFASCESYTCLTSALTKSYYYCFSIMAGEL